MRTFKADIVKKSCQWQVFRWNGRREAKAPVSKKLKKIEPANEPKAKFRLCGTCARPVNITKITKTTKYADMAESADAHV